MTAEEVQLANEGIQRAYQVVFASPDGKQVLGDLIAYCFGRKTTFDPHERVHAKNEGRREVLMRITEFCNLSIEEIYALRGFGRIRTVPQEEQAA